MRARRPHTKSRTGCLYYKRRKVKCDETRPSCFQCTRHGVACSLAPQSPIDTVVASSDTSGDAQSSSLPNLTHSNPGTPKENTPVPADCLPFLSYPNTQDLMIPFSSHEMWSHDWELMHHYCTVTAESLSYRKDLAHVWAVVIPRLGYQHSFIMHGVLGMAAAHKAYLISAKRKTYILLADYHQTLGSKGYRQYLHDYTLSYWMPALSFASIVILHMLTLPLRKDHGISEDPIGDVVNLAGLLRGIRMTLQPVMKRMVKTEFAPFIFGVWLDSIDEMESYPSLDDSGIPTDTWAVYQQLRGFQESRIPIGSLHKYSEALDKLETCAKLFSVTGIHTEVGAVQFWLYGIDDTIIMDLAALEPHALLLFAHYLVYWAVLETRLWYMRNWSYEILTKIEEALAYRPEFLEKLRWPKQRVVEILK